MAHYAILDDYNVVIEVHVGVDESEPLPEGYTSWEDFYGGKRTSYNTVGNVHFLGGTPFRKNYAGIGFIYDEVRDAFIPPKPYPSWYLNEDTCQWQAPKQVPDLENRYIWNEENLNWQLVEGV